MIIGIALVVDELHKGQRLVYRYPESIPSNVLNAHEQLLKFHRDYLSLSPDNFAKLFRPKAALFNKVLELTIDDLHYVSFPCPCSDELSSDSSVATSTDVITLFNVVIATVRESTMKALLAKTKPSHGSSARRDGGTMVKVGVDPVAVALGLGGNSYQGVPQPKLLRRVVETVSRALLHQEKRNRYVSKQVTQMLRLQEYNNGITINTVKTVNNAVQTTTNSNNTAINTTAVTTTGASAVAATTSTKTNTAVVSSSPQGGGGAAAAAAAAGGIAGTGSASASTSGKSVLSDVNPLAKRRMTGQEANNLFFPAFTYALHSTLQEVTTSLPLFITLYDSIHYSLLLSSISGTGASLFMGGSADRSSTPGTITLAEAASMAVANVSSSFTSSSSSSSSSGAVPTNSSLLLSVGSERGTQQDPVSSHPNTTLVPVSSSVVRSPSPTLSSSSLHSNMSVTAVGGGAGIGIGTGTVSTLVVPIPIPVPTDHPTSNFSSSTTNISLGATAVTPSPTIPLPSLLPLSTLQTTTSTVTVTTTTDTNVMSLQASFSSSSSSSSSSNATLLPDKNLQIMEMMQQQCSLANELRQIYHGLVGR